MRRGNDDRRMCLDAWFGLDHQAGLADVLRRQAGVEATLAYRDVTVRTAVEAAAGDAHAGDDWRLADDSRSGVWVLPAGSAPLADLGVPTKSSRLDELLDELASRFDVVLIDTPPLLLSADSLELVRHADTAMVVVRANRLAESTLAELARVLSSSPVYKMGFVLTDSGENRYASTRARFALKPPKAA